MSAGIVPSPVLTSNTASNSPMNPNNIAREATRLTNQSAQDTKYDPIPEKRVEESFTDYRNPAVALGILGLALITLGIFAKK